MLVVLLLSFPGSETETSQVPVVESVAAVQSSEFAGPAITAAAALLVQIDILMFSGLQH